jgi:hypothetical protein
MTSTSIKDRADHLHAAVTAIEQVSEIGAAFCYAQDNFDQHTIFSVLETGVACQGS